MKNLKVLYIALIALVAGAFSACTSDYEPGPQVSGPQVSFVPTNSSLVEYTGDPAEGTQKLVLSRLETKEELTVFINAEAKDNAGHLFTIPEEVTFQAGEATAELVYTIDFANFAQDKTYTVNYLILDELGTVTTPYGYREWTVNYAINPWVLMKDSKGNNAKGKFRGNDLLTSLFNINPEVEIEVDMYEHVSKKGYYKVADPWTPSIAFGFDYASISEALEDGILTTNADFIIDATNPNEVFFAQQVLGIDLGYGDMIIESGYPRYMDASAGAGKLENGIITFPARGCIFAMPGYSNSAYYGNIGGLFRIILPGVEIADYSLAVAYDGMDVAADNKTTAAKFKFTYGDDVTGIKYMVVKGNVEADPSAALTTLFEGTNENVLEVKDFKVGSKETGVKVGMESGLYTIVAAPQDKEGNLRQQLAVVKSFYFVGLGETIDTTCKFEAEIILPSEFNPAMVETYPDQNNLVLAMIGKDLKAARYYFNSTDIVATWTGTPEALVAEYGTDLPAEVVSAINSETGFSTTFSKLSADTQYTAIVVVTNIYDETKTVVLTKKTAPYDYTGEMAIGQYYMSCTVEFKEGTQSFDNVFTVTPKSADGNEFIIYDLGFNDGGKWGYNAVYDPATHTLTCDGTLYGYESYGNIMAAVLYGEVGQYSYTIISVNSENSKGNDPIVFGVDADTKQISSLNVQELEVAAYDSNNSYLGSLALFLGPTTTIVPYTEAATASVKSASYVKIPYCNVKINKNLLPFNKFQGIKAAKATLSNSAKATVKSIKPSVVESYVPVKNYSKTVKTNAEAFRR